MFKMFKLIKKIANVQISQANHIMLLHKKIERMQNDLDHIELELEYLKGGKRRSDNPYQE